MAFRFRTRDSVSSSSKQQTSNGTGAGDDDGVLPKLTNAQLNQLTKLYPPWLKDNTALKQLPGIYQGVLGQVQLQPGIGDIERKLIGKHERPIDYMNKFTDTERVHQLLSASQLSNETLATIWAHANKTFPGKLTNREVCLALALIAVFQKLDRDNQNGGNHFNPQASKDRDPFNLVRAEKKPPVPTLYSIRPSNSNNQANNHGLDKRIVQSKSTPESLSAGKGLLVDIFSSNDCETPRRLSAEAPNELNNHEGGAVMINSDLDPRIRSIILNNPMSLMDMSSDRFESDFNRTTRVWFKFLTSMKVIFKRSFDILNVEHSRRSAIEALRSPRGIDFGRNLCLCYPLAHNIKHKIDQLKNVKLVTDEQNRPISPLCGLFNKRYTLQIDDLMTSINEYWAVLINLLHESGQTEFIELIMDGLNQEKSTEIGISIDDVAIEFSARTDICSICHTRFFLKNYDISSRRQSLGEIEHLVKDEELISEDGQHYYHPKCASFWSNQVDSGCMPFLNRYKDDRAILSPALLD